MTGMQGYFSVACCGKRRGFLPGQVLVCPTCDFDHARATVIPNERRTRDVPADIWHIQIEGFKAS